MTMLQQIPEIFAEADKPYKPLNNLNFKPIQPNYNPIINSGLTTPARGLSSNQ